MTNIAAAPLSNMQVELLKLYASGVPDEYLDDINVLIAQFLLEKARVKMNKISKEKNYTQATLDALVHNG